MGSAYSLVNTRVAVSRETLEKIADLLNITTKAHRDRIFTDGLLIVKVPAAPGGASPRPRPARGGSSRASTGGGAASTGGGAASPRGRTGRRQT